MGYKDARQMTFTVRDDLGKVMRDLRKAYGTSTDGLIRRLIFKCFGEITEDTLPKILEEIHQERLKEVLKKF